jgi:molecular chaperone Hsp33
VATAALGYGLTGAALLGAQIKVGHRMAIKVKGDGPLLQMVTESDSHGHLRGYVGEPAVPWPVPIGPADVAEALGRNGLLRVVKDVGLKELTEGVIALETGELDQDLVLYLDKSEQVPSMVEIGAPVDDQGRLMVAGGLLIQVMPGYDEEVLRQLIVQLEDMPPVGTLLADGETPEQVLGRVFREIPYDVLEQRALSFRCGCSRERSLRAISILPDADLAILIQEGEAVVDCHFCKERYVFDVAELEGLRAEA